MREHVITLPDIGDFEDVPVAELCVAPGDMVSVDDPLVMVESDKAAMEVPSPMAGKVSRLLVAVGTRVSMGVPLVVLETVEGEAAGSPVPESIEQAPPLPPVPPPPVEARAEKPQAQPADTVSGAAAHATPSVRAFARELGVALELVQASGPKGRILREDVIAAVKSRLASGASTAVSAGPSPDHAKFGAISRMPLSRIQKLSGASLSRNWASIPHVTNFDEADITSLEEFRRATNAEYQGEGVKLTMLAFLIKAAAAALRAYPQFNASLDGDEIVLKHYVHIGFAADTPNGLMVPVVRDCDRKGLLAIARDIADLSERARGGSLKPADMQGGCFSVSSLGGMRGTGFTPIINAPEVAILGAARSATRPVWNGETFAPRLLQPLSLSWDHRVVDGVAAARFLGRIGDVLTDFRRGLL